MRFRIALAVSVLTIWSVMAFAQASSMGSNSGQGSSAAQSEIKALDQQQREAALKGDTSFMEQHAASDFVGVDPMGNQITRDQMIESRKAGQVKYSNIDIKDTKIRVYGNTAIVNHDAHVKANYKGTKIDQDQRATFVWVKQGGKWMLTTSSIVPIEGGTASATK